MKHSDTNEAIRGGWNDIVTTDHLTAKDTAPFIRREGNVATQYGLVAVTSHKTPGGHIPEMTRLVFVHNGRQYTRKIPALHNVRFLVTLAKRFTEEKAGQQ